MDATSSSETQLMSTPPKPSVASGLRTPTVPITVAGRRGRGSGRLRSRAVPYLFMSPFLFFFTIFFILPIIYALGLSLFRDKRSLTGEIHTVFVGLDNYSRVVQDTGFIDSVKRMLLLGVVQVPVMLGLALLFALLLDSAVVRGKTFFRLTYFVPFAVPGLVGALLWGYLYSPNLSPISQIMQAVGLPKPDFFNDALLWSIANIITWEFTGYNMIILLANLQSISHDLYEAARIDGCDGLRVAWHIKVPLVRPGLILTCVFSIIGTLQLFQEPQILGTMTTISADYTPNIYAYNNAFSYNSFNYSAALAFALALITFIFSYGFFRLVQRGQEA